MLFCRGIGRKLSIPVLVLSVVGWLVYMIGFAAFNNTANYYNAHRAANSTDTIPLDRGYFLREDGSLPPQRADLLWFPHWCVLIMGPFVYICTVVHLIVGRFFTGVFTKFLTAIYISVGGAVIYSTGLLLFSDTRSGMQYVFEESLPTQWITDKDYGLWHVLEFAGALGAMFFMTVFMTMWPFFSERYEEEYEYEEDDKQQQPETEAV